MEVGADINEDIDTCQNGEGCDVSHIIYHCIIRILKNHCQPHKTKTYLVSYLQKEDAYMMEIY